MAIKRHPELQKGIQEIITEVRLGGIDDQIGRTAIEAESYITYLEVKEDRLTAIESKMEELYNGTDPALKELIEKNFSEFFTE